MSLDGGQAPCIQDTQCLMKILVHCPGRLTLNDW